MTNPIQPDFIRGLLKNTILAQILLGFLAIIIAAQGGIPWIAGRFIPLQPFWARLFGVLGVILVMAPITLQFLSIIERSRRESARIATAKSNSLIAREAIAGFRSAFESEQALRFMIDNIHQVEGARYQIALDVAANTLHVKQQALKNLETVSVAALALAKMELNSSEENIKTSFAIVKDAILRLLTMIPIPPGVSQEHALKAFEDGISQDEEPSHTGLKPFFLAGKLYGEIIDILSEWHISINSIPSMFEEFRREPVLESLTLAKRAVAAYQGEKFLVSLMTRDASTTEGDTKNSKKSA